MSSNPTETATKNDLSSFPPTIAPLSLLPRSTPLSESCARALASYPRLCGSAEGPSTTNNRSSPPTSSKRRCVHDRVSNTYLSSRPPPSFVSPVCLLWLATDPRATTTRNIIPQTSPGSHAPISSARVSHTSQTLQGLKRLPSFRPRSFPLRRHLSSFHRAQSNVKPFVSSKSRESFWPK